MTTMARRWLESAAETRMRLADHLCPAREHNGGEHNWMPPFRHWFRRFRHCASCGYVERIAPGAMRDDAAHTRREGRGGDEGER